MVYRYHIVLVLIFGFLLLFLNPKSSFGKNDKLLSWSDEPDMAWVYDVKPVGVNQMGKSATLWNGVIYSGDVGQSLCRITKNDLRVGFIPPEFFTCLLRSKPSYKKKRWKALVTLPDGSQQMVLCSIQSVFDKDDEKYVRVLFVMDLKDSSLAQNDAITLEGLALKGEFVFHVDEHCLSSYKGAYHYKITYNVGTEIHGTPMVIGSEATFKNKIGLKSARLTALIHDTVNDYIQDLKDSQSEDGSFGPSQPWWAVSGNLGISCISMLALLDAGVDHEDPVIQKGMDWIRANATWDQTYDVALLCMVLEAFHLPATAELDPVKQYGVNSLEKEPQDLPPGDLKLLNRAIFSLISMQNRPGSWGYKGQSEYAEGEQSKYYDNSNSQYAVLGLYAAARCGVFATAKEYKNVINHWLQEQEVKGPKFKRKRLAMNGMEADGKSNEVSRARGWSYLADETVKKDIPEYHVLAWRPSYFSMTCGGVSSLSIAWACLSKVDPAQGRKYRKKCIKAIHDGLAWLEMNFDARRPALGLHEYSMYGLERACAVTATYFVGDHDWYGEGAVSLIYSPRGDMSDTALALLFFKRATPPLSPLGD